jgi:uncharacterized protein YdaL
LDYVIFGQVFGWNIGRVIYFSRAVWEFRRRSALRQVRANTCVDLKAQPGLSPNGQFFPYEIFRDAYGQRIIPENLGNLQPFMNHQVLKSRTIDEILASARRNLVLRDAWASVFIHPLMILPRHGWESAGIPVTQARSGK